MRCEKAALQISRLWYGWTLCVRILMTGCAMRDVSKPELLDAMKHCLRDLEDTKLISPGDLDIVDQKHMLRRKIDELEMKISDDPGKAA